MPYTFIFPDGTIMTTGDEEAAKRRMLDLQAGGAVHVHVSPKANLAPKQEPSSLEKLRELVDQGKLYVGNPPPQDGLYGTIAASHPEQARILYVLWFHKQISLLKLRTFAKIQPAQFSGVLKGLRWRLTQNGFEPDDIFVFRPPATSPHSRDPSIITCYVGPRFQEVFEKGG